MRLMLASLDSDPRFLTFEDVVKTKYALTSFYYTKNNSDAKVMQLIKKLNNEDRFLFDSGAFTLFTSEKKKVDFDVYLDQYIDFINKYDIKRFIELDIDAVVGYPKALEMRKKLERKTGKKSVPVWHKSRGLESYKQIVRDYDYICIGGLGNREIKKAEYPQVKQLVRYANSNKTKVHGLAFTRKDAYEYGFYSVDSSAWKTGVRFGNVHKFINGQLVTYSRGTGQRANEEKVMINNFYEWLKFQKYVDKKGRTT